MIASLVAFSLAAALLTITPGLDTALVLRTAAVEGRRAGLAAGLGISLGSLTWGAVVAAGLSALLAVSTTAYDLLRVAGAAYLIYLGARMILASRRAVGLDLAATSAPRRGSALAWLAKGYGTNILNPKVGVFYLTFLPQFIPAGADVAIMSVALAAIHAVQGILWFWLLIALIERARAWLARPVVVRWLDRATGGALVLFGVKLALSSR